MIFIDFGLLLAHTAKYLTYLLTLRYVLKFDKPTYDSMCEDNSWIHDECRQRFYETFKTFFF